MSRAEQTYRLIAKRKKSEILSDQVYGLALRIESLTDEMKNKKNPEHNANRFDEIADCCAAIRVFMEEYQ